MIIRNYVWNTFAAAIWKLMQEMDWFSKNTVMVVHFSITELVIDRGCSGS